jgi:hypothetical protein
MRVDRKDHYNVGLYARNNLESAVMSKIISMWYLGKKTEAIGLDKKQKKQEGTKENNWF